MAELGLIAGVGMLIAFALHDGLPAGGRSRCAGRRGEEAVVGFAWLAPFDPIFARHRRPILVVFAALAALAIAVAPRLEFDSDPLHTKNPNTEAMRTLYDLMDDPLTNPYSIDYPDAERGGRRCAEGEAGEAAHRLEGDRHRELRAG